MKNQSEPVNELQDLDVNKIFDIHNYIQQNQGVLQMQSFQALVLCAWQQLKNNCFSNLDMCLNWTVQWIQIKKTDHCQLLLDVIVMARVYSFMCLFAKSENVDFPLDFPDCNSCSSWMSQKVYTNDNYWWWFTGNNPVEQCNITLFCRSLLSAMWMASYYSWLGSALSSLRQSIQCNK